MAQFNYSVRFTYKFTGEKSFVQGHGVLTRTDSKDAPEIRQLIRSEIREWAKEGAIVKVKKIVRHGKVKPLIVGMAYGTRRCK